MKKNFFKYAMMLTGAVLVMASCGDDKTGGNGGDPSDKPSEEPSEPDSPISIDGEFGDWANLEGALVFELPEHAKLTAMQKLILHADELYLSAYMEVDFDQVKDQDEPGWVPAHFFFDTDGEETGYTSNVGDHAFNVAFEAGIIDIAHDAEGKYASMSSIDYDPGVMKFNDDAEGDWGKKVRLLDDGQGIGVGKGVLGEDGIYRYELQITRELIPEEVKLEGDVWVTADVQLDWTAVGALPCKEGGTEELPGLSTCVKWTIPALP